LGNLLIACAVEAQFKFNSSVATKDNVSVAIYKCRSNKPSAKVAYFLVSLGVRQLYGPTDPCDMSTIEHNYSIVDDNKFIIIL
jgi:hypothetical protein